MTQVPANGRMWTNPVRNDAVPWDGPTRPTLPGTVTDSMDKTRMARQPSLRFWTKGAQQIRISDDLMTTPNLTDL